MEVFEFMTRRELVLFLLLASMLVGVSYAVLTSTLIIPNVGEVKTIGVEAYWDANATSMVSEIDWGICAAGQNYSRTIYLKNVENTPCMLNFTTSNWNPANASDYVTLYWNYTGQILYPSEIIAVELTLSISESISGIDSFSFDLVITAFEA